MPHFKCGLYSFAKKNQLRTIYSIARLSSTSGQTKGEILPLSRVSLLPDGLKKKVVLQNSLYILKHSLTLQKHHSHFIQRLFRGIIAVGTFHSHYLVYRVISCSYYCLWSSSGLAFHLAWYQFKKKVKRRLPSLSTSITTVPSLPSIWLTTAMFLTRYPGGVAG